MAKRKMYRPDKPLGENFERLLYGLIILVGFIGLIKGCG